MTKTALLKSTVFAAAGLGLMAFTSAASAADVSACLITKTDT
ncbi:MAG: sugar ABC transporter substrate-binding protein, partial [Mesorhizobium sp.]